MSTVGQRSLDNFYRSVKFSDPILASLMADNVETVARHGLLLDKSGGQEAADRLRRQANQLPQIFRQVLAGALDELGYS